jgi:sec-independent protein translocase protein TatA
MVGNWEWVVILIVALLLFGSRLPSVMRALGRSMGEFKKGAREIEDEIEAEDQHRGKDKNEGGPSSPAG